jgi:carbonic anhydrase
MPLTDPRQGGLSACSCGCRRALSSRRQVLAAGAGAIAGLLGARSAFAQSNLSPESAFARLLDGNARFATGDLTSFQQDLTILKQQTVGKQEPFAAILSCADSRVPVELVFDQSIGHIFVSRVAGNICTPEVIASLEYGAAVLGIPLLMVLGHEGCGAVKASIEGKPVPGQISALYAPLRAAVERGRQDLTATIMANVRIQADILSKSSPVIAGLVGAGKAKVVAAYYELASGKVTILE